MHNLTKQLSLLMSLSSLSVNLHAGALNLPQKPLSVSGSKPANVVFVVDDSGSMDWQFMTQPHFEYCNYFQPVGTTNCSTKINEGDATYFYSNLNNNKYSSLQFRYIFNFKNAYSTRQIMEYPVASSEDWRIFDAEFNKIFYSPSIDYLPWEGPCYGSKPSDFKNCMMATPQNVRAHPKEGHPNYSTTINIFSHYEGSNQFIHKYAVSYDDKGFTGTAPTPIIDNNISNSNIDNNGNNIVDPWDTHVIFELLSPSAVKAKIMAVDNAGILKTIEQATLTGSQCYNILGIKERVIEVLSGQKSINSRNGEGCRRPMEVVNNYANWLQYHSRRDFAAKSAVSEIVNSFPTNHFGLNFINNKDNIAIPVFDPKNSGNSTLSDHNENLLDSYYDKEQKRLGTPLVSSLNTAGMYYEGSIGINPIKSECQTNNTILISDGFWNDNQRVIPKKGDVDGDGYGQSTGSSLSDVARYYYERDIAPGLQNKVPATEFNPNTHQHMVTYGVSFGASGNLKKGINGWPTPVLKENSDWGDPFCSAGDDNCPAKIDDLWHASYNSRGAFIQANNIDELSKGLKATMSKIVANSNASGGGTSSSTPMMSSKTSIYQGTYDASNWSGDLLSFSLQADGTLDNKPTWKASTHLNSRTPNSRKIYTYNDQQGIMFNWPRRYLDPKNFELNSSQISAVLKNVGSAKNLFGREFVNYIKGFRNQEMVNGGMFRDRKNILGSVVSSSPIYVGPPELFYKDQSYLQFKNTFQTRKPMVVVGANDGMMHVFHANNGRELMAYIPGYKPLWDNLKSYSSSNYDHKYFVNGQINATDIYSPTLSGWQTIAVSGMAAGGQAIVALNITDPNQFLRNQLSASKVALWEFDDSDDADLGYTFGQPQIGKMANGKWAVIIGNGYNNASTTYPSGNPDPNVSTTKQAHLFILFIDEGLDGTWTIDKDYVKIPVGPTNNNGLSQPFLADIDENGIVDYIYAGDLNGELWRFGVKSSDPAQWKLNARKIYSTTSIPGSGLQPITQTPVVSAHPEGIDKGVMVYFGTGKYLEPADMANTNQHVQAMYGIWDKLDNSPAFSGTNSLLKQFIEAEVGNLRVVSDKEINWSNHLGWVLPMELTQVNNQDGTVSVANYGEKIVAKPVLRNGHLIFVTLLPPGNSINSCDLRNSESWLMEVDRRNGGRLKYAVFDINDDGEFDKQDYITVKVNNNDITLPNSGIKPDSGEMQAPPTILTSPDNEKEVKITSGANGIGAKGENPGKASLGRQSWQEVN